MKPVVVEGIPSNLAHEVWGRVEPQLQRILARVDTGYSTEDVLTAIQQRDKQLWLTEKAIAVTRIEVTPQFKILQVEHVAGDDMGEWFDGLMDELEAFAKSHGCKYVDAWGRKGWVKAAKHRNYKESLTLVRKAL